MKDAEERKKYADLAVKANAENKVIFQYENGEYDLIDQQTYDTCIFDGEKWVEDANKKSSYMKMLINNNKSIIKYLSDEANNIISPIQYAIELEMELDDDKNKLKAWKKYLILLNQVDTNVEKMKLPKKPEL